MYPGGLSLQVRPGADSRIGFVHQVKTIKVRVADERRDGVDESGVSTVAKPEPNQPFDADWQGIELGYTADIGQIEAVWPRQVGTAGIEVAVRSVVDVSG